MASRKDIFREKYIGKDYILKGSDLILDKEIAWKKISRRARRAVVFAKSISGLRIEKKQGNEEDKELFRKIWFEPNDSELGTGKFNEDQHVYFAYLNDKFVAGIVVLEVDSNLFLHFNGATEEAKKKQIPSLMIWHIVEEFHKSRFKYLDVGCSFRKSLQDFFKNWSTYEYPLLMNPPYYLPKIDLSAFDNSSMLQVAGDSVATLKELGEKFNNKPFTFFPSGKYTIYGVLKFIGLGHGDEIFITTTTGSPYISSCVTTAIEAVCGWSREVNARTKAIFVIHEFGFVHPEIEKIKETAKQKRIPLIEDCAYAWKSGKAGQYGDYIIYSLPKFFPMQYGGILVGADIDDDSMWNTYKCLDIEKRNIVKEKLSAYVEKETEICRARINNYKYLEKLFAEEGYEPFFNLKENEVPGVFMLKLPRPELAKKISERCDYFGIECGAFHYNNAVFLPVHQNLGIPHLEYIFGVVRAGLRKDGWVVPPEKIFQEREEKKEKRDLPEAR